MKMYVMRRAFLAAAAFALGVALPPSASGLSLYDDFSGDAIDSAKWVNLEIVQEIRDGRLVSIHRAAGPPGNPGNFLNFASPTTIQTFQADVRLNAYTPPPGGSSRVRLRGNFYNDGTPGPGAVGDVRAHLFIRGTSSGVDIGYSVFRCADANCDTATDVIPFTRVKRAGLAEVHTLAIGWDGAVFTFTVDGVPTVVDPRLIQPIVNPLPNVPGKTLSTQVRILGPGGTGFVAGDYDNVLVNGDPYDDFSRPLLDPSKWSSLELVREVAGGRFVSKAARAGPAGTDVRNRLRFVNQNAVTTLRADVTVTAFQSTGSFVQARLSSGFYNDGTSTGGIDATGDVEGQIRISSSNDGPLTAQFTAFRAGEATGETGTTFFSHLLGSVNVGETHTLFVVWDGSIITYGMDGSTFTFDPKPFFSVVKPYVMPFKDLRTQARVQTTGGHGYIAATFDNVFVNDEAITIPRLAPFLQESVAGDVTSAGVGLRGSGTGRITLTGIPAGATVQRALLYWATLGTAGTFTAPTLNGTPVSGSLIGQSDDPFWGAVQSFAYRADVTALVPGNGTYTIAGLPAAGPTVNDSQGASLVVIYSLPGEMSRIVAINDGAVTLSGPRLQFYTTPLSGFVAADSPTGAKLSFVAGDGQAFTPEFAGLNTTLLATNEFSGSDGNFWDTRTYDVSAVIPSGATSGDALMSTGSDALVWVAAILSVPGSAPSADLSVTKTDAPDPVTVGSTLTYMATVANNGPSPATDVTLSDTLPGGVTFVSATASQGSCTEAEGLVICHLGLLAAGASATAMIAVTPATPGPLNNTASVTANEADPNTPDNTATAGTTVNPASADLSLTKSASPSPAVSGSNLTYTLTISNAGPGTASGVTLTEALASGTTFLSASPSLGICTTPPVGGTGTVNCGLGSLAPGASAMLSLVVNVTAPGGTTISNTASVSTTTADPNTGNNSATAAVAVSSAASFGTTTNFAVGTQPRSVALGDLDGDGKLDLAVANQGSNNVSILLGNGNGSFGAATNFSAGTQPRSVALGDLTGDGKLDLVVANQGSGNVSIRPGDGTGSFGSATTFAVGTTPVSVVIGDLNGDGKLDLAVANAGSNNVSVLLGTGTGSFGLATNFATGGVEANSVAIEDSNGDGKLDLIVANGGTDNVSILLGNGDGTFGAAANFSAGDRPFSVTTGDFNGDGKRDLAVANIHGNSVSLLLGNGDGTFGVATSLPLGINPLSVAVGDLNGDGKLDLAVANGGPDNVSILLGNGDGTFGPVANFAVGTNPESVVTGDINGDGKLDLAAANFSNNNVSILLNATSFAPAGGFSAATSFAVGDVPNNVAIGDLNGDGKLDLAVGHNSGSNLSILLGTGTGLFGSATSFAAGPNPLSVALGDFNRDGKLDLAVANRFGNNVSVLLGDGTGSLGVAANFAVGTGPFSIAVGDFNRDGKLDLAVANRFGNNVSVLLGDGTGSFGAATSFAVGTEPFSIALGDFNRDGKLDLAVANFSSGNVSILLGDDTGSFGAATSFAVGTGPFFIAVGDFNGDGRVDLAVSHPGSNNVSIILNQPELAAPDLVGAITGPSRACPGEVIGGAIALTVRNLRSSPAGPFAVGVYISADGTITTSDLLLTGGREFVASLGSNAIESVPLFAGAAVPTSTPMGPMFLGLLVDEFNAVVESNELNNSAAIPITILTCSANTPTVTELSVGTVGRGALNRTVILNGVNFASGTTVSFGAGITVTSVTVDSSTRITATLNVDPTAPVGPRDVIATLDGSSSTLAGAFSVTPAPAITSIITDRNDFASCPADSLTPCDPPLARDNTLSRNVNGQYLEIAGTGFQSSLSVDFGSGINASVGLTVNDIGIPVIAGRADVGPDAVLGLRTVTLENADGGRTATSISIADPLLLQLGLSGLGAPPSKSSSGTPTPPSITSINPNAGLLGSSVTISGSNFGTTTAANSVTFAGPSNTRVLATVNTASSASLTVTVPATAVDGPVTVAVNGLLSNADKAFTVANPRLSAVTPASAAPGAITLDLAGTKFQSGMTVEFLTAGTTTRTSAISGQPLLVTPDASDPTRHGTVSFTAAATTGLLDVKVTNPDAGTSRLPSAFQVAQPPANSFTFLVNGADPSLSLPSVDAVLVTLDSTGRCTAKSVTPHAFTIRATFRTTVTASPPVQVTFSTIPSSLPGTATNEDCEPGTTPTKDFSISTLGGTPDLASQQVTVSGSGEGVYEGTLHSWDWGGNVEIVVTGTVTVNDVAQTVISTLKWPVDLDGDGLPDVLEKDVALNANVAGANVLNFLNPDQNANGTRDGDDRFARDGVSNFEKYRGVYLKGPATPSAGSVTGAMTGPASVLRLGAGKRHLFVRGRGFGNDPAITAGFCGINPSTGAPVADPNPCPPFEVGGAFAERGVEVHDVTDSFTTSTVFPRRSLAIPSNATLDMATVIYDGVNCSGGEACDHTAKFGVRQWQFPTLGFSAFGTSTAYSSDTRVFKRAVDAYFRDKPYEHRTNDLARVVLAPDGRAMLAPITLVGDSSSRGADNGLVDSREATVAGQLAGDTYIAGSFNLQLSAMDATNDGCVELPFVSDPTTVSAACDPTASTANPGPQATKRQVVRSLTTHELGHAVGINIHDSDSSSLMYQYTINWTRDGHFSQAAADLIQVHNKGLQ